MGIDAVQSNSMYQTVQNTKAKQISQTQQTPEEDKANGQTEEQAVPHDEYVSSEKEEPVGLYKVVPDENGNPKIKFDKKTEQCTTNTDAVDREIKKLREKKEQLEQQIKAASDDPEKTRELERKLADVEMELNQKDNDAYRRQHAVVS